MKYLWLNNGTGVPLWRVDPIMRALQQEGHETFTMPLSGLTDQIWESIIGHFDVIVFQMCAITLKELKRAKGKGIVTVFDCDDFIDEVPDKHPNWKKTQDKGYQRDFKAMVKHCDLVTVSTTALYQHYEKRAQAIALLPNFIPTTFWERPRQRNESNQLRIGWAGGVSHVEDLEFVAPVLTELLRKHPTLKFVYTGGGGWDTQRGGFNRFGEDQFADIPYTQKEYNAGSRPATWPDRLNGMRLDIALAPLHDSTFSRAKTPIKYYEYGVNHWPGVYQKFLYGQVVKDGETGFLATTQQEWYTAIDKLIRSAALREQVGRAAYTDVKRHWTFEQNGERWLEVYRALRGA